MSPGPTPPTAQVHLPTPRGLALNARVHWGRRAARTKIEREIAWRYGELTAPDVAMREAIVLITWRGRGRLPDADNIAGRCKAYIDGLTDAGWWPDDASIVWLSTSRERVVRGEEPEVVIKAWRADDGNVSSDVKGPAGA